MKITNPLLKVIEANNKTYLYNAISNTLQPFDTKHIANFNQYSEFVIDYPYSNSELMDIINTQMASITLALTEQCNFRCKYCAYMSKYNTKSHSLSNMDSTIAFKSIDMLVDCSSNSSNIFVDFYGGEPLLQIDLIHDCVKYCKTKYPFRIPNFQITTNGLLLTNKVIDFLIDNNFYINLSLDGPRCIQDKYRIGVDGLPTFDRVFKNIITLYNRNPRFFKTHVIFNSVITPTTGTLEQFDFLDNLCKLDVFLIEATITDYFSSLISNETKTLDDRFVHIKKHPIFKKSSLKNMQKYHNMLSNPSSQIRILPGGFCVPGSRKNFITVDGKIVVCEKVDERNSIYQIGDVFNGIDMNKLKQLIDVTLNRLQKCKSCWAARFCNVCFKDIFNLTNDYCEKSRSKVKKDLIYYLEKVKDNKVITNYLENLSVE